MVKWDIFNGTCQQWKELLFSLSYDNFYQSYEWGEIKKSDGWEVVRFISHDGGISLAQVLFKRMPLKSFFFWCPGGILGRSNFLDIKQFKRELNFNFYYFRSGFQNPELNKSELIAQGWKTPSFFINTNLSMKLDLQISEDELLKNLSSNWRHNLKRFQKRNFEVEQWIDPEPEVLYDCYKSFESLKGLSSQHSLLSIRGVCKNLSQNLIIYRAFDELGELIALRGYILMNKKAVDWYAITTEKGRSVYASYGVFWKIVEDAKLRGCVEYDLSGVDPENNKGVYNFKKGTAANLITSPGELEIASSYIFRKLFNVLLRKKLK
jgi:lipid II:glycine glycyltransferase (peptidoglycan interpeptide bridge formation enzyme)